MLEDSALIPRPVGTAGQHWSLQIAMGLAGSQKKNAKYAALLVSLLETDACSWTYKSMLDLH